MDRPVCATSRLPGKKPKVELAQLLGLHDNLPLRPCDLSERDMTLAARLIKSLHDKGYIATCGAELSMAWLRGGQLSESRGRTRLLWREPAVASGCAPSPAHT